MIASEIALSSFLYFSQVKSDVSKTYLQSLYLSQALKIK